MRACGAGDSPVPDHRRRRLHRHQPGAPARSARPARASCSTTSRGRASSRTSVAARRRTATRASRGGRRPRRRARCARRSPASRGVPLRRPGRGDHQPDRPARRLRRQRARHAQRAGGDARAGGCRRRWSSPRPTRSTAALDDVALSRGGDRYEPVRRPLRARGIDEQRPLDFHSPYGCSKGAADQYVLDYARTLRPARRWCFRMSCIYGPHQFGTEDQGWVAHFLIRALERPADHPLRRRHAGARRPLRRRPGRRLPARRAQHRPRSAGQAFNMGGGPANTISLLELVDCIGAIHGRRPGLAIEDWRTGDQRYYVSDMRGFGEATGWVAEVAPSTAWSGSAGWLDWRRQMPARRAVRRSAARPARDAAAAALAEARHRSSPSAADEAAVVAGPATRVPTRRPSGARAGRGAAAARRLRGLRLERAGVGGPALVRVPAAARRAGPRRLGAHRRGRRRRRGCRRRRASRRSSYRALAEYDVARRRRVVPLPAVARRAPCPARRSAARSTYFGAAGSRRGRRWPSSASAFSAPARRATRRACRRDRDRHFAARRSRSRRRARFGAAETIVMDEHGSVVDRVRRTDRTASWCER